MMGSYVRVDRGMVAMEEYTCAALPRKIHVHGHTQTYRYTYLYPRTHIATRHTSLDFDEILTNIATVSPLNGPHWRRQ